jgi:hypothetical protein
LKECGYRETVLLELTASPGIGADAIAPLAVPVLTRARARYLAGDWQGAVAACREAIETETKGRHAARLAALNGTPPKERDKLERTLALSRSLWELTSAAHHADDNAREFNWARADAQHAIAITVSTLKLLNGA